MPFLQTKVLTEDADLVIEGKLEWRSVLTPVVATTETPFLVLPSLEMKFSGSLVFTTFNFCPIPFHAILTWNFCHSRAFSGWADKLFTSLQFLSLAHQKCCFSSLDGVALLFFAPNHPSCYLQYSSKIFISNQHHLLSP